MSRHWGIAGACSLGFAFLLAACSPATTPPVAQPAAQPAPAKAAPQANKDARYIAPPSLHFHLPLPPDVELVEWRKGHDPAFAATVPRGALPPTDTEDTLVFGRHQDGRLRLVSLRYAHRLVSEGSQLSAWLEATLAPFSTKPGYRLLARDRSNWITQAPTDVRYQVLFTYSEKGAPQSGHLQLFMHGDNLMLFALVAPEASFGEQNPVFSGLMNTLAFGPAPKR